MSRRRVPLLLQALRIVSLVFLAGVGTVMLTRWAPGFLSDVRELDPQHSAVEERVLATEEANGSIARLSTSELSLLMHGSLGRSRQYDLPVGELLRERATASVGLLGRSLLCGWLIALCSAILFSARRSPRGEALIALPVALALSVPVGVLATFCVVTNNGGPVFVLGLLIAVRDFKMLYSFMRRTWKAPHFLLARAQGQPLRALVFTHMMPGITLELASVLMTSLVVALSALVPVEVVFDLPGLGQLAWNAAMNRDLPVLVAVTLVLALCVAVAGPLADRCRTAEQALSA